MTTDAQGSDEHTGSTPAPGSEHGADSTHAHHRAFPVKLRFLEELKRRNLVRVAILYVIACYVILEPTHLIFFMLEVPVWLNRAVVLIMVAAFPLVMLFSWIYEVTPEGLRPTVDVHPSQSITHRTGQKLNKAIIVVLSLALAYFVADKFWLSGQFKTSETASAASGHGTGAVADASVLGDAKALTVGDKSIAVLPFLDMSEKKDQEFFSDGLAEELLDLLSRVPELHVAARTSAFSFKGKAEDVPTIARKLLVANVLEGSVRKSGNNLRITVQLIRADNGYHLWSQTFDRKFDDIFKIQNEIASAVVQALKVSLLESSMPKAVSTPSTDAYTSFLKARAVFEHPSRQTLEKAADALRHAQALDPTFAPAWALFAQIRTFQLESGYIPLRQARDEARSSADRAIKLDPDLCEAQVTMARIHFFFDWDWDAARADLSKALRIAPNDSNALRWMGTVALMTGRL